MPPRSCWKGFLKLSLVSVPVKAYSASVSGCSIRLNQLHRECHSPVKYRKLCPIHGELATEAIVSGYEYAKGRYVEIDPDELAKLRTQSEKAITIDGFLYPGDVDPIYYNSKTYYLVADRPVDECYVARQPCLVCGRAPGHAHHLRFAQPRALGRKVSDEWVVPLCATHHRALHSIGDEERWWKERRIEPSAVALKLWQKSRGISFGYPIGQPKGHGRSAAQANAGKRHRQRSEGADKLPLSVAVAIA